MKALLVFPLIAAALTTVPAQAHLDGGKLDYVYTLRDIQDGAQLRAEAGVVIPIIFDPCGSSKAMEPVQDRYAQFVEALTQVRHRIDMDIALADYDYQMSLVDIHCPDLNAAQMLERDKLETAVANSVLDRMDVLVQQPSGQDK